MDSSFFFMRGYLRLIQNFSVSHMYDHDVCGKKGISFTPTCPLKVLSRLPDFPG